MPSDRNNYQTFVDAQHQRKNFMRNYNNGNNGRQAQTFQSQSISVPDQN